MGSVPLSGCRPRPTSPMSIQDKYTHPLPAKPYPYKQSRTESSGTMNQMFDEINNDNFQFPWSNTEVPFPPNDLSLITRPHLSNRTQIWMIPLGPCSLPTLAWTSIGIRLTPSTTKCRRCRVPRSRLAKRFLRLPQPRTTATTHRPNQCPSKRPFVNQWETWISMLPYTVKSLPAQSR